MTRPRTIAREDLEERAAIIEEGEKCSRWMAQKIAAEQRGYASWSEAVMKTAQSKDDAAV